MTVQDIFKALQSNQFDMLVEPLQEALKGWIRIFCQPIWIFVGLDYQEQIRKKKEETLKKQQTQSEATIENNDNDEEEEEINEPTIE